MKIEVGKTYELNNGDVHECTEIHGDDPLAVNEFGYGPFVIGGCLYHQDGTFGSRRTIHESNGVNRCVSDTLTIEPGKCYRTRDGRKVGPMVRWCNTSNHPFEVVNEDDNALGRCLWGSDGKCDEGTSLDLIAEWTETRDPELTSPYGDGNHPLPETGLGERYKVKPELMDFPTMVTKDYDPFTSPKPFFHKLADRHGLDDGNDPYLFGDCDPVSASDTPKTWSQMSGAEKGALLLAQHEGKVIEFKDGFPNSPWMIAAFPTWVGNFSYRARPELKRETVVLQGTVNKFSNLSGMHDTHRITFTTTDGKPDLGSIKMEEA